MTDIRDEHENDAEMVRVRQRETFDRRLRQTIADAFAGKIEPSAEAPKEDRRAD